MNQMQFETKPYLPLELFPPYFLSKVSSQNNKSIYDWLSTQTIEEAMSIFTTELYISAEVRRLVINSVI